MAHLAITTINRMAKVIDDALEHAFLAGCLASNKNDVRKDGVSGRNPQPTPLSLEFFNSEVTNHQKPKLIRRTYNLLTKALEEFAKLDFFVYHDKKDPLMEMSAMERRVGIESEANEVIEGYRGVVRRSQRITTERLNLYRMGAAERGQLIPSQ